MLASPPLRRFAASSFEVTDRVVRIAFDADFLAEPIVTNYLDHIECYGASLATFRAVAAYERNVPRALEPTNSRLPAPREHS